MAFGYRSGKDTPSITDARGAKVAARDYEKAVKVLDKEWTPLHPVGPPPIPSGKHAPKAKPSPNYAPFGDHYNGVSYAPVKTCVHYGEDPVFTVGQRSFYGARGNDANPALYQVVLDCAGMVKKPFLMTASAQFRHLVMPTHFLRLHWPDMGVPPVAPAWWLRLARAIPKRADTLIACVGSHGRTGTALALLALAYDVVDTAPNAIALIRKEHCTHAIESKSQEKYIADFAEYLNASH